MCINDKFGNFLGILTQAIEVSFPEKSKLINTNSSFRINWFTDELKQKRTTIHLLQDCYDSTPTENLRNIIKQHKYTYHNDLINAKKLAHDNFIPNSNNHQSALWKIINNNNIKKNSEINIPPNELTKYFTNVASNIVCKIPSCQVKISKVIPIHKKNSKDDPANYRPIVTIPFLAKIFEVALKDQITEQFERNNLFNLYQFSFRAKQSTTLAINSLIKLINQSFEDGLITDCVSHGILIKSLS